MMEGFEQVLIIACKIVQLPTCGKGDQVLTTGSIPLVAKRQDVG